MIFLAKYTPQPNSYVERKIKIFIDMSLSLMKQMTLKMEMKIWMMWQVQS
jgi:hypothetical protein